MKKSHKTCLKASWKSNILIISDTHLTEQFDQRLYHILKRIIEPSDYVIINGDFWDGYVVNFDTFLNSRWKKLFPLLKKKKTYYLYGNHDAISFSDYRVSRFSTYSGDELRLIVGSKKYHIEHGNRLYPSLDHYLRLPNQIFKVLNIFITQPLKSFYTKPFIFPLFLRFFNYQNKKIIERKDCDCFLITGHTHGSVLDQVNKYANSGFIEYGRISYLTIHKGILKLHHKNY